MRQQKDSDPIVVITLYIPRAGASARAATSPSGFPVEDRESVRNCAAAAAAAAAIGRRSGKMQGGTRPGPSLTAMQATESVGWAD